jgi:hypothetical protein
VPLLQRRLLPLHYKPVCRIGKTCGKALKNKAIGLRIAFVLSCVARMTQLCSAGIEEVLL